MKLFESITVGTMQLPNRIVTLPMGMRMSEEGGAVSQRLMDYYIPRARGGPGLLIVEATAVDPIQVNSPTSLAISDDRLVPGLSALVSAIKAHGVRTAIQIQHPGRQTRSKVTGVQPVAPSPIPCPLMRETPRELTLEEIDLIIDEFAEAARRAKEAGFDAIEIHGAHGYLICQFLSPSSNQRNDEYGGDLHRRTRFALEVLTRCREMVGPDYPILFRFSADEHVEGGLSIAETKVIARLLEEAGADCLSVSAGNYGALHWAIQPMLLPRGCLVPLAAEIKKVVSIPVITAGRITDPILAERILEEGKADLIGIGRGIFTDPDWPKKAREGRYREIKKCMGCNTCLATVPRYCLLNPDLAREGQPETRAEKPRKVLILGGGPAGLEAARVAQVRGHQTTLWDREPKLGGRWSWLITPYLRDRMRTLKELGVKIELGKDITPGAVAEMKPDVVLATPGTTQVVPGVPGIEQHNVVAADDVLAGKAKIGGEAVILGAGNTGCETALFLRKRGVAVTILERTSMVAHGLEACIGKVLAQDLAQRHIKIVTNSEVVKIEGRTVVYRDREGQEQSLPADHVILALDSTPDNELIESLRGENFEIIPLPHCQQPGEAYVATQEGADIARRL